MIKLKNIKKNNDTISCLIYPEDSKEPGNLIINLSTKVEKYNLPDGYDWCKYHVSHASRALIELAQQKDIPSEKLIMWV